MATPARWMIRIFGMDRAPVKNLEVKGAYDRETGALGITMADIDFGGPKLSMAVAGTKPKGWPTTQDLCLWSLTTKLTSRCR